MSQQTELKDRIRAYAREHPNAHLRSMADVLGIPEREIAANIEGSVPVPVSDFFDIWEEAAAWESCLFFVDHGNVVVEAEGPLPRGTVMFDGTLLNLDDHTAGSESAHGEEAHHDTKLGGHIYPEDLQAIYLIRKQLYGKESLSVMFYDSGKGSMFGLFAGRGADREILPSVRKRFDALWDKYTNAKA